MTRSNRLIEEASRRAGALPLARIAAAMLGGAAAFFCFAMPAHVRDTLLAALAVPVPTGVLGATLFVAIAGLLAAALGGFVLTLVTVAGRPRVPREAELDMAAFAPRRRPVGPSHPGEAIGAPPPALLAVRRGDGHPDAPPRRPIFAHELGASDDTISADGTGEVPAPARSEESTEPVQAERIDVEPSPEQAPSADLPGEEPLELSDAVAPAAAEAPIFDEEPSLAALMARFEDGLERRGGKAGRPAQAAAVPSFKAERRDAEDALRDALDALQRMAARQR